MQDDNDGGREAGELNDADLDGVAGGAGQIAPASSKSQQQAAFDAIQAAIEVQTLAAASNGHVGVNDKNQSAQERADKLNDASGKVSQVTANAVSTAFNQVQAQHALLTATLAQQTGRGK